MNILRPTVVLSLWTLFLFGCNKPDQVERYTVEKLPNDGLPAAAAPSQPQPAETPTAPSNPAEAKDRMLAAMVVDGDQGWFFKATGPKDALAEKSAEFNTFIKSIKFEGGKPQWTLPEGWTALPGSGMRFSTIQLDKGDKPLELSVIALPKSGVSDAEYVLMNVNRWRGQMQLPPTTAEKLADETTKIPVEGREATLVDLVGSSAPSNMGSGGPFSGGQR